MTVVVAAAGEYLLTVECLTRLLAAPESRPVSRADLDGVIVSLPRPGAIASAELFRDAIKRFEEVFQYEYILRNEIDAPPDQVLAVSSEVHSILSPIIKSRPKSNVSLI